MKEVSEEIQSIIDRTYQSPVILIEIELDLGTLRYTPFRGNIEWGGDVYTAKAITISGLSQKAEGQDLHIAFDTVSAYGVWLLAHDKELFMSYEDFPWFKKQTIESILNVEEQGANHFCRPDIDVDLTLESIEHPERFPLKAKNV